MPDGLLVYQLAVAPARRYKRGNLPNTCFPRTLPMATERTFSIIKPDATERNLTGAVNAIIEKAGLSHRLRRSAS